MDGRKNKQVHLESVEMCLSSKQEPRASCSQAPPLTGSTNWSGVCEPHQRKEWIIGYHEMDPSRHPGANPRQPVTAPKLIHCNTRHQTINKATFNIFAFQTTSAIDNLSREFFSRKYRRLSQYDCLSLAWRSPKCVDDAAGSFECMQGAVIHSWWLV